MGGFAAMVFFGWSNPFAWLLMFALAGIYMAVQEALEPAMVADFVADKQLHGTAYGALGVVNGLGDVGASLLVGVLVNFAGWATGLGYAAAMMTLGAGWMTILKGKGRLEK
jgi:hypothetical protein